VLTVFSRKKIKKTTSWHVAHT